MSTDEQIALLQRNFDEVARQDGISGVEFWYARDLQSLLGYVRWENFSVALERAKTACKNASGRIEDHFRDVTKMVDLGSGAKREIADVMLTRYACYLIAQNGDPRKEQIAFAQSYFAVQTRRQELIRDRMNLLARLDARERLKEAEKRLSQNIYERGVDDDGFARIRSKGDAALFGGNTTAEMKNKFGMPENRPLADFLPTLTIAAKNLATEITNHNVEANDLRGESPITREHVQNNLGVREMLNTRGIIPENLPPAEDIKKLERRVRTEEKRLAQNSKLEAIFNRFRGNVLCALALVVVLCFGGNTTGFSAPAQKENPTFSVSESETEAWNATLDDYVAGTLNTRIPHTVLSEPPLVLARLLSDDGCGSKLRIIIHKSILDKTFGKTASKFTGDFHKINLADIRNLQAELANPIAIFDSAHGNGDKVVLTEMKDSETGESVIVAIKINVPGNNAERVHAVASIHGRKIGSFHKWLKDGYLRYYHTKKFPQWLVSVGVRNPQASIPRGNEILTEKDFRKGERSTKKRKAKK